MNNLILEKIENLNLFSFFRNFDLTFVKYPLESKSILIKFFESILKSHDNLRQNFTEKP
jgi:hypothetical protein